MSDLYVAFVLVLNMVRIFFDPCLFSVQSEIKTIVTHIYFLINHYTTNKILYCTIIS